jgi:hypothetical protein
MSDTTINLPRYLVERSKFDRMYYVFRAEHDLDGDIWWEALGKGYVHSTSAYAKLGRIVNKLTNQHA